MVGEPTLPNHISVFPSPLSFRQMFHILYRRHSGFDEKQRR
jgi:hypothetical protein